MTTGTLDAGSHDGAAKPSAARDRILATAHRLFYRVGIRAVGVDRVIAESAVARMTFFRHFPTKDDLVLAFLQQQATLARHDLVRAREDAGDNGPRAVLEWVAGGITTEPAMDGFRGCEFINTAAEFSDPAHPVRVLVEQHRSWIRDQLQDALTRQGHPNPRGHRGDTADAADRCDRRLLPRRAAGRNRPGGADVVGVGRRPERTRLSIGSGCPNRNLDLRTKITVESSRG